jgi:hypothetical protein
VLENRDSFTFSRFIRNRIYENKKAAMQGEAA